MKKEMLNNIIECKVCISNIEAKNLHIDDEDYKIHIKRRHLIKIMQDFINGKVSKDELESWAELLEGRDSVEYEEGYEDRISDVLFWISTPDINKPINNNNINEYIEYLTI